MPFGLSGLAIKLISYALALMIGFGGGVWLTYRVEQSRYLALELSYKEAQIKAIQEAQKQQHDLDLIAITAAQKEATNQSVLTAKAKRQLAEVSKHVKDRPNSCITYGFIRVLDGAVHGVIADSLALPTGKSDDACAPVDTPTVARSIVDNYNTAGANKEQLNSLIAVLRDMAAQHNKK